MRCTLSMKWEWPTTVPAAHRTCGLAPTSHPKQCQLHLSVISGLPRTTAWVAIAGGCPSYHYSSPHLQRRARCAEHQVSHPVPQGQIQHLHQKPPGDLGKAWTLQLAICYQEGETSLWAQATISWPVSTRICTFYMASSQLGETIVTSFHRFCFGTLGNCRINLVMSRLRHMLRLEAWLQTGKKREGRRKKRLLEETTERSSTVQKGKVF